MGQKSPVTCLPAEDKSLIARLFGMPPVKIAVAYFILGVLWIIFSDNLFLSLPVPREELIIISSAKGIFYVIITTILLFLLVRHYNRQWQAKNDELSRVNRELIARDEKLVSQNEMLARSQAEWEITFNAIPDWICLIDPEGKILRTNQGIRSLLDISPDKATGMHCYEIVHGLPCPVASCPRIRMLQSKRRESLELPLTNRSGWIQITVDPVFDPEGYLVSAVHVVRDITDRMQEQKALDQAKKKLHLLNYVTFNEIQTAVFSLWGFQQFIRDKVKDPAVQPAFTKEDELLTRISGALKFAQAYQNLGIRPPAWQDVSQVFLLAISHLDFLPMEHSVNLDGLEIFADPLLEQVLQILADNTLVHGERATRITLWYSQGPRDLTLYFEDNGMGIPDQIKGDIFSPDFQKTKAIGLFLAREILEITGIAIYEAGTPGEGARFAIIVPREMYRFAGRE